MADGEAVSVVPHKTSLTTQEAAEFLGISRPTLIKLLQEDRIPYSRPGRHRRVGLPGLLAYQQSIQSDRRRILAAMTAEASDEDGYDQVNGFVTTR